MILPLTMISAPSGWDDIFIRCERPRIVAHDVSKRRLKMKIKVKTRFKSFVSAENFCQFSGVDLGDRRDDEIFANMIELFHSAEGDVEARC
jgi:hypothetical protein